MYIKINNNTTGVLNFNLVFPIVNAGIVINGIAIQENNPQRSEKGV